MEVGGCPQDLRRCTVANIIEAPEALVLRLARLQTPQSLDRPGMTSTTQAPRLSRADRFGSKSSLPDPADQRPVAASPFPVDEPAADSSLSQVVGVLERLTRINEQWSIGNVFTEDRKEIKVVGNGLKDLAEGNEYTFFGKHITHPKFGDQFDVATAAPYLRPDRNSIVKYIIKHFKGVGPTTAEKYLNHRIATSSDAGVALEEVRQQLINAPWTLDFSAISKKATFKNSDEVAPIVNYVHRDLATRLGGMPGMKDSVLRALAQYLYKMTVKDEESAQVDPQVVQKCWAALVQDPYAPTIRVPGYAFTTADLIGASVNIPREAPVRLKALVAYALDVGCKRSGHVYLTHTQISLALSAVDKRAPVEAAIRYGLESDMIRLDDEFGEARYYSVQTHDAEIKLAESLAALCIPGKALTSQPEADLREKIQTVAKSVAPQLKNGLDESQVDALVGILTSKTRLHTITAGPGCGKTQLMEVLTAVLDHKDFLFCGPTGKSAKVLNSRLESLGRSASTIHSMLQGSGRGSFRFHAGNKLETDVLVVDETSMNDIELAESVTAAVDQSRTHVIFLGDENQLPSIGLGRFLKDLLEIEEADHHRLTKTHRNSGGILDVIEQVRQGRIDCQSREAVRFSGQLDDPARSFIVIASKYLQSVTKYGYDHTALLMSMRAGEADVPGWNTTYANAKLRAMCNPNGERIFKSRMHVGDRILIKENMNVALAGMETKGKQRKKAGDENEEPGAGEVRIVNGDTGTITSYARDPENPKSPVPLHVRIKLDDGRIIDFPGSAMDVLEHSYALTVHSAQGSEYKKVIAVITPGHSAFINRAMLFTCLSRARAELDVNADDMVLRRVASTPLPARNSGLVERVSDIFDSMKVAPEKIARRKPQEPTPSDEDDSDDGSDVFDLPEGAQSIDLHALSINAPQGTDLSVRKREEPPARAPAHKGETIPSTLPPLPGAALRIEAMSRAQRFASWKSGSKPASPPAEQVPSAFPRQRGG